ncbi:MAG: SDR family oxidoreductase [Deltaproteobacteria bacterium]|nr:SDR family oxidoreductase [Deltaproteobacteria bacterium]MBI3387412.1 SDR family oxidoreductase [Deltaproteobacteria bacterium]
MKLAGRVALITGAGSGLGREIALTFAAEGASIAINDVDKLNAAKVVKEIEATGGKARAYIADVSDSVEVAAMFEHLVDELGTIDILVNNAGVAIMSDEVKANFNTAVQEMMTTGKATTSAGATRLMSDSQWRRTLSIHLDGTFYCTREALKVMEPKGAGKIINMASVAGTTGLAGSPDYSAAKGGIIALTKSIAREVIGRGIYVNAIAPGYVDTPLLDVMDATMRQMAIMQTPIGRLGTPAEIAAVALYLASADSSYTVGQVISPNGGYHM